MKKGLLLIALIVMSCHVFAFTTQGVWRWRKDDGSETTATWRAAQNTPITVTSTDSTLRLRIELYNNGSGGLLDGALFEDSSNEAGSHWDTIRVTPGASAFALAGTSPNVTDLEPTTHQLSGQTAPYTFTPGKMIVATDTLPKQTVAKGNTTEFEYVFKPTANIKPSVTYYFRVDAANYLIGYQFPSLTTSAVLPVTLSSFKVEANKNQAIISWTTANEINSSHYDVERSADGKTYTSIATVKSNGAPTSSHNYKVVDSRPLSGNNYYRIKEYDVDGSFKISEIRSVKFALQNALVTVYPNPSHGDVNFLLQNYAGTSVKAVLTNVSGKRVHEEVIAVTASGTYKLHLASQLPAGIYILNLEGDGLSQTVRVMVQ